MPSDCQGVFPDVPCSSPFAPWIEDLYNRQIATTRGQMAPFLVKTFGLLLYGP